VLSIFLLVPRNHELPSETSPGRIFARGVRSIKDLIDVKDAAIDHPDTDRVV
jgi:hypothetical protein